MTPQQEPKGVSLEEAKKNNKWGIIPLSKLPDNCPVIGINRYPNKAMAEFQLVEEVIVPWPDESAKDKERIAELTAEVERLKEMMIEKNNIIR